MKALTPPAFRKPLARLHHLAGQMFSVAGEPVFFGVVTTQRDDGAWDWEDHTVIPEHDVDFPPQVGAHYLVLVLGPNYRKNFRDFQAEHALVIGQQIDDGKTVNLLQLQTSIEPNPLYPEAIIA